MQIEQRPFLQEGKRKTINEKSSLYQIHSVDLLCPLLNVGLAAIAILAVRWIAPLGFTINDQSAGWFFVLACAYTGARCGVIASIFAVLTSCIVINYWLILPYGEWKLEQPGQFFNTALFAAAASLIALLACRMREAEQEARKREETTQVLFTLYRAAADAFSRPQALEKLQREIERIMNVDVAFFLPHATGEEGSEALFPVDATVQEEDKNSLQICWSETRATGIGSTYNPNGKWRFEPMMVAARQVGVLGVKPRPDTRINTPFEKLLAAIAEQTACILEHIQLECSLENTRILEEREKLRSMLLSSVSHDFKTPLAGIIGALSVHRSLGDRLSPQKREELLEAAMEEAHRLDSFVTNILDMTRLESGNIRFNLEWHTMESIIKNVKKRLQHRLQRHELVLLPGTENIDIYADAVMTEQVLQNVLDNACKYTPAGTAIEIECKAQQGKGLFCSVRDHGGGIPAANIESVFDKYTRLHKKDSQVAGTGLGLAISRAVMEAQGGRITAANHLEGGAVFTLWLPQWRVTDALSAKVAV